MRDETDWEELDRQIRENRQGFEYVKIHYNPLPFNPNRLDDEREYKCYLLWEKYGRDINAMNRAIWKFIDEKNERKKMKRRYSDE